MTVRPARRSTLRLGLARGHVELLRFVRNRDAVVFTFALPTVLLVLLGSVFGGRTGASGVTASQVLAAGMVAAGVMSTTFVSLGLDIATDRDDGTLKRLRGTPMPATAYLVGKVVLVGVTTVAQTALPPALVAVASLFPVKWMAQGFRSVFLPDEMARFEVAGAWELDRVALVLGAWCVAGLVLSLILPVLGPRRRP